MEEVRNIISDTLQIFVTEKLQSVIVGFTDFEEKYWSFLPAVHKRFLEVMQESFGKHIMVGRGDLDYVHKYIFDKSVEFQLLYDAKKYIIEIIIHSDPFSDDEHIAVLSLYEALGLTSEGQLKQS